MKKIVIMAGGTGGHVFPALAVAQALQDQGWQVSWLGTAKGLESRVVPEHGIELDYLAVAGIRGKGVFSKITAVFGLMKACAQAFTVLRRRKPNVVLGMGGFVAGPGGLMAKVLGIPLVIHEQNRVVGTTNRLLARFASRVLEAFPNSFAPKIGAVCTGNPLRRAFVVRQAHHERQQTDHERQQTDDTVCTELVEVPRHATELKLLIIGGSQGAKILNETVPAALALLKQPLDVTHQTGAVMQKQVAQDYAQLGINANVQAFIADMVGAYSWADLIICRAGAMTVSEVAAIGLPAIFVPLPTAIDDHQNANARYLADAGGAVIIEQKNLTPSHLAEQIQTVMIQLNTIRHAALACARLNATQAVADICTAAASA